MRKMIQAGFVAVVTMLSGFTTPVVTAADSNAVPEPGKAWIEVSNRYTQPFLDINFKYAPEQGSSQGLAQYDALISNPTLESEKAQRSETVAALAKLKADSATEKDKHVLQDMEILRKQFELGFRTEDYANIHAVPFINASAAVFGGLQSLLDDQVPAERRPAAVVRLRKYAGMEPGFKPFADLLKQRELEQMAKPDVVYPSRGEMETELSRNASYLDGLTALFVKYKLSGWKAPLATLKTQLVAYDAWVSKNLLPKARTDFRLPAEDYALSLEGYGIDIPPAQLADMAHAAFVDYQQQMTVLAAEIAKAHDWPSSDYRDVVHQLKKEQVSNDALLPLYQARLKAIEEIIVAKQLVTLPTRPAIIRLATPAESVQQPAPHMNAPAFLNNTGQRGEFVLPLDIPAAKGVAADKYDDFGFDAVSWTLTAHEARPGHELQFASMLEHGVSLARALYAFNSTNVEGWGLYSEWIMEPYEPIEARFETLQLRMLRAARAFIDPELQSGTLQPEDAYRILEKDVVLSHAFAKEEVERFTYRAPGQANSYFYGYTKLLALRKDTEAVLGAKFSALKFHDFLLSQGLLPPDLMRKAVMEEFVPAQRLGGR